MIRVYKNTDLNFPIHKIVEVKDGNSLIVRFFTTNEYNYIERVDDDIVDGHIMLSWHDLVNLEQGVLNVWFLETTPDETLEDGDYDVATIQNTPYYIMSKKATLTGDTTMNDILNNYYTKPEIDRKFADIDLSDYYTKSEVDEALQNVEVDLTGYAKKATVTQEEYDAMDYYDPDTIYIITDAPIDYYTKLEIDDKLANIDVGDVTVDLTGYATEQWVSEQGYLTSVPEEYVTAQELTDQNYATEKWVEDKGYITGVDLSNYATEQWVSEQGYITSVPEDYITESELSDELSNKADKSEIPTLDGYATEQWVSDQLADVEVDVDLTGYATEEWIKEQDYTRQQLLTEAEYEAITPEENVMYIITDVADEWIGTQAEYDALPTKHPDTTYFIIEE